MTLHDITHTARRSHLCASCGRTVHTGEQYVRAQMPGGGRLAKVPLHTACYTARLAGAGETKNDRPRGE